MLHYHSVRRVTFAVCQCPIVHDASLHAYRRQVPHLRVPWSCTAARELAVRARSSPLTGEAQGIVTLATLLRVLLCCCFCGTVLPRPHSFSQHPCASRVLEAADAEVRSAALDVNTIIAELRTQRAFMVQTDTQYIFCYVCVLDGLRAMLDDANRDAWSKEVQVRDSTERTAWCRDTTG